MITSLDRNRSNSNRNEMKARNSYAGSRHEDLGCLCPISLELCDGPIISSLTLIGLLVHVPKKMRGKISKRIGSVPNPVLMRSILTLYPCSYLRYANRVGT